MSSKLSHPGIDFDGIIATTDFANPEHARGSLQRIAGRISALVFSYLPPLLADSSNPGQALVLLDRFFESPRGPQMASIMEQHPYLLHYAIAIFASSQWLGETLLQNPELLRAYTQDRDLDLDRSRTTEELHESYARFRASNFGTDLSTLLARFKRREYVRFLLRDALGIATLAETTAEISSLSDVLIEVSLRECLQEMHNRYGVPQQRDSVGRLAPIPFAVLSLGKLGGNELNYSSDIDLLYLYGDGEDAGSSAISAREFFIKLGQELTTVLSHVTGDGPVFRMDLRLRPRGHEGEPAIAFSNATEYYSSVAEDWELQALIKLRHTAGDEALSRSFIRAVEPYVYRKGINFSAIKTALASRERIERTQSRQLTARRVTRRVTAAAIDVKIGRGGIRDIEFLVQCLQRVYGGEERWLRSSGTLFSLQKLYDKGHLSGKDFHELTSGYDFLRRLEHRLQLRQGQQTHRLPTGNDELIALYKALHREGGKASAAALVKDVEKRMASVTRIYERIVLQQYEAKQDSAEAEGAADVGSVAEKSYTQLLARLRAEIPSLCELAQGCEDGSAVRRNLYRYLASATTSSHRVCELQTNADAVAYAMPVFAHSTFLADILVRHPGDIAVLLPSAAKAHERTHTGSGNSAAELRYAFRHKVLKTAGNSILQGRLVWETLAEHTQTAEKMIRSALESVEAPELLAVVALGRLGSREFDILSDADIVFLRDESTPAAEATHAAEAVVSLLSSYTREGTVMAVDTRLRPHGNDSPLVTTPSQLSSYFAAEAEPWEALSWLKARCLSGTEELQNRCGEAVESLHERYAADPSLQTQLLAMRKRQEVTAPQINLKLSAGGVYDLDYICGLLSIRHHLPLAPCALPQRLEALREAGALTTAQAETLEQGALLLRSLEHSIRLAEGRARKWLPADSQAVASIEHITALIMGCDEWNGSLEAEVRLTMQRLREVFQKIVGTVT